MPAYANFAAAYAASGTDLFNMSVKVGVGWTNWGDIMPYIDAEDWRNALIKVRGVLWCLLSNWDYFIDDEHGSLYENAFNDCSYWNNQLIDAAEVDMDSIIVAMLSANPDQVEYFVGLVDAYRQSIWNRPFNESFYAALARGFMIWP